MTLPQVFGYSVMGLLGIGAGIGIWSIWEDSDSEKEGSDTMPNETSTMKLSEAITKGIAMRPKRAHGVYFAGEDRSDVLGAAYQGHTGKTEVHNYQVGDYLERTFPILKKKVMNPETGETKTLKTVLRSLNDKHRWKRKNVVRFVKSVEDRATIANTRCTV